MMKVMEKVFGYICSLCGLIFNIRGRLKASQETFIIPIDEDDDPTKGLEEGVINGEKINIQISNNKEVQIKKSRLDVRVKLFGSPKQSKHIQRLGADIVIIFDVRYKSFFNYEKGRYMEEAFEFFIGKLTPIDRLSVLKVSANVQVICSLNSMTSQARYKILHDIHGHLFNGDGNTPDFSAGLREALQVLNNRGFQEPRKKTILLFSNTELTRDVLEVPLGDVPVHAFPVGSDFRHDVLREVASKSNGGTFSILDFDDTEPRGNFRFAFLQCLTRLSKVPLKELELTFTPIHEVEITSIHEVVGQMTYNSLSEPKVTDSITLSLGNIYSQDVRDIRVRLSLPEVVDEMENDVLQINYSYSDGMESYIAPSVLVTVTRTEDNFEIMSEAMTNKAKRGEIPCTAPPLTNNQYQLINGAVSAFNDIKNKFKPIQSQDNVNKGGNSNKPRPPNN